MKRPRFQPGTWVAHMAARLASARTAAVAICFATAAYSTGCTSGTASFETKLAAKLVERLFAVEKKLIDAEGSIVQTRRAAENCRRYSTKSKSPCSGFFADLYIHEALIEGLTREKQALESKLEEIEGGQVGGN